MAHLVGHRTLKAKSLNYELTLFETEKTDTGGTEGEGKFAFFSAKHWDRRERADLRDQSLLMVGGGAEDIKGGSPIIFLPRWGARSKIRQREGGP